MFEEVPSTQVSPEDLASASATYLDASKPTVWPDAPVVLRVFRSGVKVLSLKDDDTPERVLDFVRASPHGASPLDLAQALHVPAALAQEHLQNAEASTCLCRDKGPTGLRFYPNAFRDFSRLAA